MDDRKEGHIMQRPLTCVEMCAAAGGQAVEPALAGFVHYCETLKLRGHITEDTFCTVSRNNYWHRNIVKGETIGPRIELRKGFMA